ncbi:MAG: ferritin-like domain-containing protein [Planctomycetota bacterium]
MSREESLRRLNELFAEEIEAGIRYLLLAVTVRGLERITVQSILLDNMKETLDHAQQVAEKILQLGGNPSLDLRLSLPPEKPTGVDAVRTALIFEQAALDAYRELLEKVSRDGDDDVVLEEFLRAQVALESEHVAGLELLLEE